MTATRSAVLGGVSTLAASVLASGAGIVANAAALESDAELLALRPAWEASVHAFNAALEMLGEVETRAFARMPEWRDRDDFDSYELYASAHEAVCLARAEIEFEEDRPEAKDLEDETSDANRAIVDHVVAIPARTLAGLRFKVGVSEDEAHNHAD